MSRLESGEGGGSNIDPEMGLSEPLTSWLSPGLACAWSGRAQASPRPGAVVGAGGWPRVFSGNRWSTLSPCGFTQAGRPGWTLAPGQEVCPSLLPQL